MMRCFARLVLANTAVLIIALPASGSPRKAASPLEEVGSWFNVDDYPLDALRDGKTGRVVTKIGIDSAGKVVTCTIGKSSGTKSLDDKTCEILLERARYRPATDEKGSPTASEIDFPMTWTMPEEDEIAVEDASMPQKTMTEVVRVIGITGLVESCTVVGSHDLEMAASCLSTPPGLQWNERFIADGKPVRVTLHDTFSREVRTISLP